MCGLEDLQLADCHHLDVGQGGFNCFPTSSMVRLRVLDVGLTGLPGLPDNMPALEDVTVTEYPTLNDGWLPIGSRGRVRVLRAVNNSCTHIPANMCSLEELLVSGCSNLAADGWLPASSKARLRSLTASHSSITCVPGDLCALTELNVSSCGNLDSGAAWLPDSSVAGVTRLHVGKSNVERLPDMPVLAWVDISSCKLLSNDWLPECSTDAECAAHC